MNTAQKVREAKEKHPERYCPVRSCLWNTTSKPCGKHPQAPIHMGLVVAGEDGAFDLPLADSIHEETTCAS